jgi:hypothetical protein
MRIQVDTAADAKGNPAPSSIRLDGRNVDVADVVDQWGSVGEHYFKVKDASDNIYILHFDEPHAAWELVVFMSKRGTTLPDLFAKQGPRRLLPAADGKL